jgi:hypothetical protein
VAEGAGDEVHPVAGGRRPMALKLCTRMGSVRHKSVAKAVAGEGGGLTVNGGGGTQNRQRGKHEMQPAQSCSRRMMASRGMVGRARTRWTAHWRTGGSGAGRHW